MAAILKAVKVKETTNKIRYDLADTPTTEGFYFRKNWLRDKFVHFPKVLYMAVSEEEPKA